MRSKIVIAMILVVGLIIAGCGGGPKYVRPETNLPISNEAQLVEATTGCEWMVNAAGIGEGKEKYLDSLASEDARKSAVYFVLMGGTDPLLKTQQERNRFNFIKEELFLPHNYRQYIAWEESQPKMRVFIEGREKLKIEKRFRVNRCALENYLSQAGVVEKVTDISVQADLGMPTIAVMPQTTPDENPVDLILGNPDINHAATVIESHLTVKQFDVVIPTQTAVINEMVTAAKYFKDAATDNEYLLASTIGADVYITFTVEVVTTQEGGQNIRKATTTVKAFETTTARSLGSETGYSRARPAPIQTVIEEGLNDAVAKVISRIESYWKRDLERGIQYKMHFALNPAFSEDKKTQIKFAVNRLLKDRAKSTKPQISTENNFDYLIWVDPADISDFITLQMYVKSDLEAEIPGVKLREVMSNSKLVIYEVE